MAAHESENTEPRVQILATSTLYAPEEALGPACVVIEGTRIRDLWYATTAAEARQRITALMPGVAADIIDMGTARLAPGYIDLHIHGFHGYDVNAGSSADLREMARLIPSGGVTAFYPTIAAASQAHTVACVVSVAEAAARLPGAPMAEIVGIRLEGPFISPIKKGAQYGGDIRPPDPVELSALAGIGQGLVRLVDFAPEEEGAAQLLETAVRLGIVPCIGHTNATYEQAIQAIAGGARHSTHLFNAMSPLKHHAPGVPGALL
ncbi:MAG TPA: amidohydrolase family protein, partial [Ktedonobacterales bacterium]|nr:amidohydrolase family protein [Ktedonobacterales bacterium]